MRQAGRNQFLLKVDYWFENPCPQTIHVDLQMNTKDDYRVQSTQLRSTMQSFSQFPWPKPVTNYTQFSYSFDQSATEWNTVDIRDDNWIVVPVAERGVRGHRQGHGVRRNRTMCEAHKSVDMFVVLKSSNISSATDSTEVREPSTNSESVANNNVESSSLPEMLNNLLYPRNASPSSSNIQNERIAKSPDIESTPSIAETVTYEPSNPSTLSDWENLRVDHHEIYCELKKDVVDFAEGYWNKIDDGYNNHLAIRGDGDCIILCFLVAKHGVHEYAGDLMYGFGAEDIVGLRKELVEWMIGNDDEWNWSLKVGDMKLEDFLPRHVSMLGAHIFALAMMLEMELKLYVQTNIDDVKMYKSDCSHPTKSDASSSDTMDSTNNPIKTRRKKKKRYKEKRESDDSSVDLMDSTNNSITTRRKKKKRHKEKRESDDSSVVMMDSTNNSRLNKKSKAKRNTNLRLNKKRVKQGDDAENGNNGKRRQNVGAALWLVGDYIDHCYHRANDPKARTKLSLRVSQTQHRSKYITSVLRAMLHQEVVFQKDDMNKQMTMKQWMENKKLDWKTICQKGWKRGVGAAADATCEIVYSALMSGALRAALAT
eukprot:12257_1